MPGKGEKVLNPPVFRGGHEPRLLSVFWKVTNQNLLQTMTVRLVIMSFLCLHVPESITNQFICKYIYISIYTYRDPASFFPLARVSLRVSPHVHRGLFQNQNRQDAW